MANKPRDTTIELAVRRELHRRGLRYRIDYRAPGASRRTIDIAFTRIRVAVLIDGCFWHSCPLHYRPAKRNAEWWADKMAANRLRDADTNERLTSAGWRVLRFWEHESPEAIANEVASCLAEARVDHRAATDHL
jgi:DNA mismatch endonuclease (patch repair protein)